MNTYNPLLSPCCLQMPERLSGVLSWIEHIPFAFALIDALRPRLFVELGTHKGDSYCAFCQAVKQLEVGTRCFAIDKWTGDDHSGQYGPAVLAELQEYHHPRYGHFSTLAQMEFDAARPRFGDGTIDLLHIDGYHTYEAVRHDFETWLPTLSARGVVLFHDTQVREKDFGVWKLWDEIRGLGRHLEFEHGNGLGVLAVGKELPPAAEALFDAAEQHRSFFDFFALLGKRIEQSGVVTRQSEALTWCAAEAASLRQAAEASQAAQAQAWARVAEKDIQLAVLEGSLAERTGEAARLSAELDKARLYQQLEIERLTDRIQWLQQISQDRQQHIDQLHGHIDQLHLHIGDTENYYSQARFRMAEWVNQRARRFGRMHVLARSLVARWAGPPHAHVLPARPHFAGRNGMVAADPLADAEQRKPQQVS